MDTAKWSDFARRQLFPHLVEGGLWTGSVAWGSPSFPFEHSSEGQHARNLHASVASGSNLIELRPPPPSIDLDTQMDYGSWETTMLERALQKKDLVREELVLFGRLPAFAADGSRLSVDEVVTALDQLRDFHHVDTLDGLLVDLPDGRLLGQATPDPSSLDAAAQQAQELASALEHAQAAGHVVAYGFGCGNAGMAERIADAVLQQPAPHFAMVGLPFGPMSTGLHGAGPRLARDVSPEQRLLVVGDTVTHWREASGRPVRFVDPEHGVEAPDEDRLKQVAHRLHHAFNRVIHHELAYTERFIDCPGGPKEHLPDQQLVSWGQILAQNYESLSSFTEWETARERTIKPAIDEAVEALNKKDDTKDWATLYRIVVAELLEALGGAFDEQRRAEAVAIREIVAESAPVLASAAELSTKLARLALAQGCDLVLLTEDWGGEAFDQHRELQAADLPTLEQAREAHAALARYVLAQQQQQQ